MKWKISFSLWSESSFPNVNEDKIEWNRMDLVSKECEPQKLCVVDDNLVNYKPESCNFF